jgi:T-complex protein 1 subunit zeta
MHQAERHLGEGLHPRVLCEGFDLAKSAALRFAADLKVPCVSPSGEPNKDILTSVARTALRTKLHEELADQLTDIVVDAVLTIRPAAGSASAASNSRDDASGVDLHMVEILAMKHRVDSESRLVRGVVLDHGARHPDMPKHVDNAFVLTCNLSLEYERSEVNSTFMYSNAEQRERMVAAERAWVDDRVAAVVALKRAVCVGEAANNGFVVITQKGIDPPALDALARAGILGLRRAKRRNMERLTRACGGVAVESVAELNADVLGFAKKVYEHQLGEEAYTFVEDVRHPESCTILLKGSSDHGLGQMKDAVRDGLRAVKNALDDGCVVPGAGAFEVALCQRLLSETRKEAPGRVKLGVQAFADALLVIPKTLAENAGLDVQQSVLSLQDAFDADPAHPAGLDLATGEPCDPGLSGIYDNYCVKTQVLHSAPVVATQLLLTDELIRAGVNMRKAG